MGMFIPLVPFLFITVSTSTSVVIHSPNCRCSTHNFSLFFVLHTLARNNSNWIIFFCHIFPLWPIVYDVDHDLVVGPIHLIWFHRTHLTGVDKTNSPISRHPCRPCLLAHKWFPFICFCVVFFIANNISIPCRYHMTDCEMYFVHSSPTHTHRPLYLGRILWHRRTTARTLSHKHTHRDCHSTYLVSDLSIYLFAHIPD